MKDLRELEDLTMHDVKPISDEQEQTWEGLSRPFMRRLVVSDATPGHAGVSYERGTPVMCRLVVSDSTPGHAGFAFSSYTSILGDI